MDAKEVVNGIGDYLNVNDLKISVLILTYNSSYDDLMNTVDSILKQKEIELEIVISDDGSTEFCIDEIGEYLNSKSFTNYKIIKNKTNVGTVKNFYYGLQNVSNEYVKDISPGDMLYGEYALRDWLRYVIEKKADWSFCNVIYYKYNNKKIIPIEMKTSPQNIRIYNGSNFDKIRWQYFVLGDISVGAAMIFKKKTMLSYTEQIIDEVKYAEDNIFRMAMFDGVPFCFCDRYFVLYEYGTGISTSKNEKWSKVIEKDFNVTNDILSKRDNVNCFQRKMIEAVQIIFGKNKFRKIFVKSYLIYRIYTKMFTRKSIPYLPKLEGTV